MISSGLTLRRWALISGLGAVVVTACSTPEREFAGSATGGAQGTGNTAGDAATGGDSAAGTGGSLLGGTGGTATTGGSAGDAGSTPGGTATTGGSGGAAGNGIGGSTGGSPTGGASGAGGAVSCVEPELDCLGLCTDVTADAAHCGYCGNACDADKTCQNSVCVCGSTALNCADVCVDPQIDRANCGTCGNVCEMDRSCAGGNCVCSPPLIECNGLCINPVSDIANCGDCGNQCINGQSCASANCVCPSGSTRCTSDGVPSCVNTSTSTAHCGACDNACGVGQSCVNGSCTCGDSLTRCDGECVQTLTDGANCGSCGNACAAGTYCSAGLCIGTCLATECGTSCVNTNTDINNCGGCNQACTLANSTQQCEDGSCTLGPCNTGWYNLDTQASTGCEYYCPWSPLANEVCSNATLSNDGKDNDCNGSVDCAFIESTFPEADKSAAGEDMFIKVRAPFAASYTFQCRSAKVGSPMPATWTTCPAASGDPRKVLPWSAAQSASAANDGRWVTEVRLRYPDGRASLPTPGFSYYLHSSLHGANVSLCPAKATDAEYFAAASPYLTAPSTPVFAAAQTLLANPFINVTFDPPMVASFSWEMDGAARNVQMLSLRRRFAVDANRQLLVVSRAYTSSRGTNAADACEVGLMRKHDHDLAQTYYNHCDAWVLNKAGAGVCLKVQPDTTIRVMNPTSAALAALLPTLVTFRSADSLMWRKLQQGYDLFSPKCYSAPACATGGTKYLPDRNLFPGLP